MRRLLLLSSILVLAACSPTKQSVSVGDGDSSADNGGIVMEQRSVQWRFEDVGTEDAPQVKIVLVIGGGETQTIELGTYAGSASDTTDQQTEALLAASAWWAGGGDDVRVLANADGTLTLQHRTTDEVSGLGEWETLQSVEW